MCIIIRFFNVSLRIISRNYCNFSIKKKLKKPKEVVTTNNLTVSGNSQICNSVARNDTTNIISSQEKEKSSTNLSKVQTGIENSINFTNQAVVKSNDIDKKPHSSKHKDRHIESGNVGQQAESNTITVNNSSVGKISVVPTAQLMAQKPTKSHALNLMDLTNSSLSITPVNDYSKLTGRTIETKKDVVSITACPESVSHSKTNELSQTGHHSVYNKDISYPSTQTQHTNYSNINQTLPHSKSQPLKHKFLHENADAICDKRLDEKDVDVNKIDKKEKKRERSVEIKHKSHDAKKKKKESKITEQQLGPINQDAVPMPQQTSLSKEEQEQRQNEETIAATNFLSQIINDDISPRGIEKRKDNVMTDDNVGNLIQPTEQEKDVQMVMRSLKELQELQEMKYCPSKSAVGGAIQKANKSRTQYITYQEEYQPLYLKKGDKIRSKEEAQW